MDSSKRKELNVSERKIIVHLRNQGKSYGEIADIVNRSRSTIARVIENFNATGNLKSKTRSGRPKKVGKREEKFICREVNHNPRVSLRKLSNQLENYLDTKVHPSTVSRALHRAEYKSCVARKKPFVSTKNISKRLQFAKEYVNKDFGFWSKVIFSDESKFNIYGSDGRVLVWRKKRQALLPKNMSATVKHGGGGVMVWGCMSASGVGNLKIIENMNEEKEKRDILDKNGYLKILKENLKESATRMGLGENFYFQHDNDPKHTAYVVRQWIAFNVPHFLQTPPQSPDVNPIENLWAELEKRIRQHEISSKDQLKSILVQEWKNINSDYTKKLVESIPKRLQAVIDSKGWPTKY